MTTYTYNWFGGNRPGGNAAGRNLSSIQLPAQMPMFADGVGIGNADVNQAPMFILPSGDAPVGRVMLGRYAVAGGAMTNSDYGHISARHFEGMNMAFADGHVKWSKGVTNVVFIPAASYLTWAPPQNGMDFDGDGILGNDSANGTAGIWD